MMMLFTNNATSRLYADIDAVTTSIRVQAGDGAKFPVPTGDGSNWFTVTLEDRRSNQLEICNCVARSGDILNVQRAQEGTAAQAFVMGATVSNRLTAATMDFLAHAGATGPQGPQGDVGPPGATGATGPQGVPGTPSTIPGPKGDPGATGPQGAQGAKGDAGPQGATGPQGSQGPVGATGPQGSQGPQGAQGLPGTGITMKGQVPTASALPPTGNVVGDAYVTDDTDHLWVWSAAGYWADMGNIVGPAGPDGPQGVPGPEGPVGPVGPPGEQGIPGPTGPEGPQGTTDWDDLTNVPATFPPTLPVPWTGISGTPATFPPTLPIDWADISPKPSTFPPTLPIPQSGVTNLVSDLAAKANLNSPTFTGDPTAPTPVNSDNDTSIATTAFVKNQGYAPLASPVFTGDPQAPTPVTTDNDTSIATTAFVRAALAQFALSDAPADGLVYGRKNNNWATVIGGASTSDGPPAAPLQNGQLWWETDTGNLHIYYNDGNSSQWVQLTGQTAGQIPNIDKIVSAPANMLAGFRTSDSRFVVNSQADGLGFNIFAAHRGGVIQYNDLEMSMYTSQSPNLRWALNDKGDGSGNEIFSVDSLGTVNASGNVTAFQNFLATAAQIVLAPVAAGTVYLRANGYTNAAGQVTLGSNGQFAVSKNISVFGGSSLGDTAGSIQFDSFGTCAGIDFGGPTNDYGLVMRNRISGVPSMILFRNTSSSAGVISCPTTTTTTYGTTSDIRTKGDVGPASDARSLVDALEVIEYSPALPDGSLEKLPYTAVQGVTPPDSKWLGISAQQAYAIYPPAVVPPNMTPGYREDAKFGDEDFTPWMVDYSKFVPMLLANLQEANARIDALEARLAALEGSVH